uniref:Uncharacterized protein n=1 Tax=Rhizophora mucronata TaxID=61149 RepID=A0A2P2NZG3_RHIMU
MIRHMPSMQCETPISYSKSNEISYPSRKEEDLVLLLVLV